MGHSEAKPFWNLASDFDCQLWNKRRAQHEEIDDNPPRYLHPSSVTEMQTRRLNAIRHFTPESAFRPKGYCQLAFLILRYIRDVAV